MTYELKIERLIDAPPELVFDTMVDPEAQPEIFAEEVPGWNLWECQIDLRVGGEWTFVYGRKDRTGEPDRNTSVFIEIDRPRRLAYRASMFVGELGARSTSRRPSRSRSVTGRRSSRSRSRISSSRRTGTRS